MSANDFLAWQGTRSERYELVDGQPVPMPRASVAHDSVVTNAKRIIESQLVGKAWRPRSGDVPIKVSTCDVRRPDLSVDCGTSASSAQHVETPVLVVEVEAPGTGIMNALDKFEAYRSISSLQYILLASTRKPRVRLCSQHAAQCWDSRVVEGDDAKVELPHLGVTVSLAEIYASVTFAAE